MRYAWWMVRARLGLVVVGLVMTSCMFSPAYRMEQWAARCTAYGNRAGTQGYAVCMQLEEVLWQQRFDQAMADLRRPAAQSTPVVVQPVIELPRHLHCTTRVIFGTVHTDCD